MSEETFILNAEGNFFIQEKLADAFAWLTCTGVGDIGVPQGDRTPVYCPDPLNSGQYKIEGFVVGDVGAGSYTLEKPLSSVWNLLIEMNCDFQARINWVCRGLRRDPRNYEIAALMLSSTFNAKGIANPVRTPEGSTARVLTNGNVDFIRLMLLYRQSISQHTLANTADANGVFFLPQRCEDRCGPARDLCSFGIIGCDNPQYPAYLYDSEIKKTEDGVTWAATATDPYAYGGGTQAVYIFETVDGQRMVVFRHTQVPGHPAECSWSEDDGLTWNNVEIGVVNNQAVNAVALCAARLVVACTGGYIYSSIDQGATWVPESAGVLTTEDLQDVVFYDDRLGYAVGDNNVFLYSTDGGGTWYAGTGPAVGVQLLSVATNMKGHVFVTTNDARVFVSEDEGDTWIATPRVNLAAGTIPWLKFDRDMHYVGYLEHNPAVGRGQIYRSEDGGATWFQIPGMPDNSGLNSGFICDHNHVVIVGNAHGGTTFVATVAPAS